MIPQRVYWLGSLDEATASLQRCIDAFLAAANRGRQSPTPDVAALDAIAHQLLVALRSGRHLEFQLTDWPPWFYFAFINIHSNVRSGDYHLLPCCVCGNWMHVKSAARGRLTASTVDARRSVDAKRNLASKTKAPSPAPAGKLPTRPSPPAIARTLSCDIGLSRHGL